MLRFKPVGFAKPSGGYNPARIALAVLFAVVGATVGIAFSNQILTALTVGAFHIATGKDQEPTTSRFLNFWGIISLTVLGGLLGLYLGSILHTGLQRIANRWDRMDTGDKVTLFVGVFAGIIVAMPIIQLANALMLQAIYVPLLVVGVTLGFSAIAIYALHSMEDVLPWSKASARSKRTGLKVLDTNVIIDGRIYDVARTGFLEGEFYVPGFVLDELQHIADHHDPLRRQRGRRGLDVLRHMQAEFPMEVRIYDKHAPDPMEPVDSRLVRLAKALGGDIVTNDYNLNRVAGLQDVKVLSLNDLTLALRSNVMPQESIELQVIREGNQPGQGIGYLEDGTMVVVENGKAYLGETVDVVVSQVIQTGRGKMIFAEICHPDPEGEIVAKKRRPASH